MALQNDLRELGGESEPSSVSRWETRRPGHEDFAPGTQVVLPVHLAIDLCTFGRLEITNNRRIAVFQGQRAPGY